MVQWIHSWLSNRLAYIQFGNSRSKTKTFKQGVPQGSVISPTLFLVHIDEIKEGLEEDLNVSLFADDFAVCAQSRDIEAACQKLQRALDYVNEVSLKSKLSISKEKCECSFFSTTTKESKHVLDLYIGGTRVKQTENPKFLCVTYDRQLRFNAHVRDVTKKIINRSRVLYILSGTDWGYNKGAPNLYRNGKNTNSVRWTGLATVDFQNKHGRAGKEPEICSSSHYGKVEDNSCPRSTEQSRA